MSTTQPTRHPPEVIEAAHVILDPRCDTLRLALAIKRLNEGTGLVNLRTPETITKAAALVLRDALACAEAELAEAKRRIADDNKAYGCELMDPCGTIWDQCAKVQKELAAERQRREKAERKLAKTRGALENLLWAVTSKGAIDTRLPIEWSGSPFQNRAMYAAIDGARKVLKGGV